MTRSTSAQTPDVAWFVAPAFARQSPPRAENLKQCAAVRTHLWPMIDPPQEKLPLSCNATCHGCLLISVFSPPTIRRLNGRIGSCAIAASTMPMLATSTATAVHEWALDHIGVTSPLLPASLSPR